VSAPLRPRATDGSGDLHYRFPPAAAYRLNRCLFALKSDPAFRARYLSDPDAAMREIGLAADEQAALGTFDRDALVACGAHRYLVFMAELRLRMDRSQAAFERF
jgi:aromatic-ring opening dioxygenase LigAB LigA subunit